ncbi:MAG TPA: MarR family transcriptional regulator [Candidatus Pullilachnospira intestinigallinarum]|nr:MarR family transcriptional regulator [Candidatus Pullilachnospira intestinigallinarum]
MDRAYDTFHDVLVNLFNEIMDVEEKAVITPEFHDITNNDMHVMEAVGVEKPQSMSAVARILSVTVGTLTIAVNNLVKKGYISRERSSEDRRVVLVSLTDKGRKAYAHHKRFHEEMIHAMIDGLSEKETETLVTALTHLKEFFENYQKKI